MRQRGNETYALTLTVKYETQPGEELSVIGNLKETGEWKDFDKAPMKWTEGHVWVTQTPLIIQNSAHFNYKYVVKREGGVEWESGANRIADLDC